MTKIGKDQEAEHRRRMKAAEAERRRRIRGALVAKARNAINELSVDEQASLVAAAPRMLARRIPPEHEARLIDLGLAEQKLGGFTLTTVGRAAARLLGSGA